MDESASIDLTRPNDILGSAYYMSPEQARSSRDVVPQSDIYSLGAVLYKLLAGQTPFPKRTLLEVYEALLTETPLRPSVLRPEISPELDKVILRCLEKNFERRFSSAIELISALTPFTIPRETVKVDHTDSDEVTTLPRARAPRISQLHSTLPLGQVLSNAQSMSPHSTQPLDAKSLHAALHGYLPPRAMTRPPAPSQPKWDVSGDDPTPRIGRHSASATAPLREPALARSTQPKPQPAGASKNMASTIPAANSPTSIPTTLNVTAAKGTVYLTSGGPLPNESSTNMSTHSKVSEMTMTPWNSFPGVPQKSKKQTVFLFMIGGAVAIAVILLAIQLLS
jgi:serine/threonine protein kinase